MPQHDELVLTDGVRLLSRAIANAEGFGLPGAIPTLANNPGDLVIPDWNGKTLGHARIAVFSSEQEGWMRLYRQLELIAAGRSRVYALGMTLEEMAHKWTTTQAEAWASNVCRWIAATGRYSTQPSTTLRDLLS